VYIRLFEMKQEEEQVISTVAALPRDAKDSSPGNDTYLTSWKLFVVIGSLCLGILLFGLDVNILGTAIPQITTDFGSLRDVAWYGSAYLLTVTAFQPLFGNFYKFFNPKLVYLASLLVFEGMTPFYDLFIGGQTYKLTVGSVVCAAAPNSWALILGRAVLGFGAAGLLQGALAIIGFVVPLGQVPMYQGVVVSSLGVSVCIGPVIGGALTEHASWRMYIGCVML
jgi:MFS family permease